MSNDMPPDLIEKILYKLPVKSLLRFTLLHKSYHSLINSDKFIADYTPQPNNPPLLFIGCAGRHGEINYSLLYDDGFHNHNNDYIPRLHFPFGAFTRVVSCSNGLVCLFDSSLNKLILWNPCVQKFRTLPDPNSAINGMCFFGLGFVNETNDYKVLMISDKYDAEIYSLERNSWKIIAGSRTTLPYRVYHHRNKVVAPVASHKDSASLNGSLYWLTRKQCVGVFDFENEVFDEISLPDDWGRMEPGSLSLMVYKESLIAFFGTNWDDVRVLDVDEMGKTTWKHISITFPFTLPRAYNWRVMGFKKSGEVIVEDDDFGIIS